MTEPEKPVPKGLFRRLLSTVWTAGLFVLFVMVIPYCTWWVADYLDALYLMFVPIGGCLYLMSVAPDLDQEKLLPILRKIEDPFTRHPDPKVNLLLLLLPLLSAGMMLPWFFAAWLGMIRP